MPRKSCEKVHLYANNTAWRGREWSLCCWHQIQLLKQPAGWQYQTRQTLGQTQPRSCGRRANKHDGGSPSRTAPCLIRPSLKVAKTSANVCSSHATIPWYLRDRHHGVIQLDALTLPASACRASKVPLTMLSRLLPDVLSGCRGTRLGFLSCRVPTGGGEDVVMQVLVLKNP